MGLREKIQGDLKGAIKGKIELETLVLRQLSATFLNKEKEKRFKIFKEKPEADLEKDSRLTDEEVLEVISSEAKKRKESISEFEKGGRRDLAEKEKKELIILEKYLPEQMSEEDLREIVREAVKKVGASNQKDIGKVMAELMPRVKGRADGSLVSKMVKEFLAK
ncbi:MAG: GatB/YqeY domain-containing protein [bacterium]|nr:GatB/YqeY domain-containing protein [bacterium]